MSPGRDEYFDAINTSFWRNIYFKITLDVVLGM